MGTFNYSDKCPICGNSGKGCRHNNKGIYFCRSGNSAPDGLKYIGDDSHGFGMYMAKSSRSESNGAYLNRQYQPKAKAHEKEREVRNLTQIEKRDRVYQFLPQGLAQHHFDSLKNRGLSDGQIDVMAMLGIATWQPKFKPNCDVSGVAGFDPKTGETVYRKGFVIPALTLEGRIAGYQIANDDRSKGKYVWLSSSDESKGANASLPNGEMPLAIWNPKPLYGKEIEELWIDEGFLKSAIVYTQLLTQEKHDIAVIGCAGSSPINSPKQLKEAIEILNPKRIRLFPDAGAIQNPNVMESYRTLYTAICDWGWEKKFSVAWWSQLTKESPDVDELGGKFPALRNDLHWRTFDSIGVGLKGFKQWQTYRTFTPDVTLEKSDLIDGKYFSFRAPKEGEMLAIKAPTGAGKGQWMERVSESGEVNFKFALAPTTNLGKALANNLSGALVQDYIVAGSKELSNLILSHENTLVLPPDSLRHVDPEWARGKDVVFDEALENYRVFLMRDTAIKDYRQAAIKRIGEIMAVARSVTLLDGNLNDTAVEWYEAIAKNKKVTKVLNPHWQDRMSAKIALEPIEFNKKGEVEKGAGKDAFLGSIDKNSRFFAVTDSKADSQILSAYSLDGDSTKEEEHADLAMRDFAEFLIQYLPNNVSLSPAAIQGISQSMDKLFSKLHDRILFALKGFSFRGLAKLTLWQSAAMLTAIKNIFASLNKRFEGWFSHFYGYFCGVVGVDNILQGLARLRDFTVDRTLWIASTGAPNNTLIDAQSVVASEITESLYRYLAELPGYLHDNPEELAQVNAKLLDQLTSDPTHKAIAAEIAAINYERKHLRACVVYSLIQAGHSVETYTLPSMSEVKEAAIDHKADKKAAKKLKIESILKAHDIGSQEAEEIERKTKLQPGDRTRLERFYLLKSLPGIQDSEFWHDDAPVSQKDDMPKNVKFVLDLPKLKKKAEQYYLLLHPEILRRRGQSRYQGFINAGSVDLNKLKVQYTRIASLIKAGLLELIDPTELRSGSNSQTVDTATVTADSHFSIYIKEENPQLANFCSRVANGKGGESIARGKRTRIQFLADLLEEFGLSLQPVRAIVERDGKPKLEKTGEWTIVNPWIEEGNQHSAVFAAVCRRFEQPDGEKDSILKAAQKPFEWKLPESVQSLTEDSLEAEFEAAVSDLRAMWLEADSDEVREMLWSSFTEIPIEVLNRAIPKTPVEDADRKLKPWEARIEQMAIA